VIVADDVGVNDIGAWGAPTISTPNIDQMASEGLKLTQFYSAGTQVPRSSGVSAYNKGSRQLQFALPVAPLCSQAAFQSVRACTRI